MAPASVNRTCTALKAALNLAANQDERIISRRAWENGLALIPNADEPRNVILADDVVRSLVAEAHNQSPQFGLLVELAAITGARPSQMARLQVQDLQDGPAPRLERRTPFDERAAGHQAKRHAVVDGDLVAPAVSDRSVARIGLRLSIFDRHRLCRPCRSTYQTTNPQGLVQRHRLGKVWARESGTRSIWW